MTGPQAKRIKKLPDLSVVIGGTRFAGTLMSRTDTGVVVAAYVRGAWVKTEYSWDDVARALTLNQPLRGGKRAA